jgi:hypothetical protein
MARTADEATGTGRKFTQVSRSWHRGNGMLKGSLVDEFWIVVDVTGKAGIAEFGIAFHKFDRSEVCARVQVYDESFVAFEGQVELRGFIREGRCTSPDALREFLTGAGYSDETQEQPPDGIRQLRLAAAGKLSPEERDALRIDAEGVSLDR